MKNPFHNQYFRIAVTAWSVIVLSICFFFALFKMNTLLAVFKQISLILQPFTIGFAVAYLLLPVFNGLVARFQPLFGRLCADPQKARRRNCLLCSLISVSLFILLVTALLTMVMPQLAESILGLSEKMPDYLAQTEAWLSDLLSNNPILADNFEELYSAASTSLMNWAKEQMIPQLMKVMQGNFVSSFVSNAVSFLKNVFVGLIAAIYMLSSKDTFAAQSKKLIYSVFEVDTANMILENLRFVHKVFGGFISGKLLDSLIIGVITFFCITILNMPYVLLISVIIGVTNIIPFFGPFIGAVPSTVLILLANLDNPLKAVYFVLFILVLQQFDGNILGPKILGDSTGLASFWVLFAILVFGGLFGFVGMIVGVPLFAVIYSAISGLVNKSLHKREMSQKTTDYVDLDHINTETGEMIPLSAETVVPTAVKLERRKRPHRDKNNRNE